MSVGDHNNTLTASEFLASIKSHENYMLALGSYSPDPEKVNRYFLYRVTGNELEWMKDAWILTKESDKFKSYKNITPADSDAMYGIDPSYIWCFNDESFRLFESHKLLFYAKREIIWFNGQELKTPDLKAVHTYLIGWTEFGVKLLFDSEEILLVKQSNEIAAIDITYDGFNLLVDSFWVCMLGKSLAKFLDKENLVDDDLK